MVQQIPAAAFYRETTRKTIIAFGNLFSGIVVQRYDNSNVLVQSIPVPIAYANKDKFLQRVDADPANTTQTKISLPRMAFEVTSFAYDASRNLNKNNVIICNDPALPSRKAVYTAAPYNISISMSIVTKAQEDGVQILEQILPYFRPDYMMSIMMVPELNIHNDIPIVLNSVSGEDNYSGSYEDGRIVTHDLTFTIKTWMYGPTTSQGVITTATANLPGFAKYQATGTVPTSPITESWTETLF